MFERIVSFLGCALLACNIGLLSKEVQAQSYPFTPEEIARAGEFAASKVEQRAQNNDSQRVKAAEQADIYAGGAAGVDQRGGVPDCWFESAVAALARLPDGRQILSHIITKEGDGYIVLFPDQPQLARAVTSQMLAQNRVGDSALWARILDEAAIERFPFLAHGEEKQLEQGVPNAAQGLSILTGTQAHFLQTANTPEQKIAEILQRCAQNGIPMVAGTQVNSLGDSQCVIPGHSYTVMGFDPAKGIVELRNPFGNNGLPNQLRLWPNLPQTGEERAGVAAEGGGLIRMDLAHFKKYYRCLCWAPLTASGQRK